MLNKKSSIRSQFMIWIAFVVILSISGAGWVINSRVEEVVRENLINELSYSSLALKKGIETTLDVSVRNHLRGIAEKNIDILNKLHQDAVSGNLAPSKAKQLAQEILLTQKIGTSGYIYVLDSQGFVQVHPKGGMENRNISEFGFVQTQMKHRKGYLAYEWRNPGEQESRPKVLYMEYFKPWDWIVSVSGYRDEFVSLVNVDDLKSHVLSIHLGKTGHAFILDSRGNFIVHPRLSGRLTDTDDPETWEKVLQTMKEERNGQASLTWKKPGSVKGIERLVFFHDFPELGLFVATAVDLDELSRLPHTLRRIILTSIIVILILVLPISFLLASSITRSLTRLAEQIRQAQSGDFSIRADENAKGEVGLMAGHFNDYMARLQHAHDKLQKETGERNRAEARLEIFSNVFENAMEGISITDAQGNILTVNRAFSDITGYGREEVIGQNPRMLKSDRHDDAFYRDMWQSLINDGHWMGEIWNRRKSGEAYPEKLNISAINNSLGETTHYIAVFHDISEMKSQEEQIQYQVYHDALTGLPNRNLSKDRLAMAIAHARRQKNRVAVFFLNMDNFKYVNDSLGHTMGDLLLQEAGKRLKNLVREEDTVARLGGDEFLIIAINIQKEQEVIELAERLIEAFKSPFFVSSHELFVTLSVGITVFPDDGSNTGDLMKNADVAMVHSKSQGKNKYNMFTQELSRLVSNRIELMKEFRQALNNREFTIYFQPKVNVSAQQVTGVEALVRWQKPDGSLVSPDEFIPMAEDTGLILPLGALVLEESCRALAILGNRGFPRVTMAVNLSPLQFKQADMVEQIRNVTRAEDISPDLLELEITENIMMTDLESTVEKLNILKQSGFSIAIDDFGTGYSSLYYLKTFPIKTLKIDRSFIRDITSDASDAQIVETIILMARNLGLKVVAEGVETREQKELLDRFGCDSIQGFYYARPMPLNELIPFLEKMEAGENLGQ
ncbi:bifunctional diguanylate cyclase/phosphodiesterase [Desulfospira joergensenii]|uniref:bifunctional diguanylate cyclase/phosphodiesterase n=1 Tax=Desulfospira joergensenii TaxID=53329 RepID=UPI0003B68DE1|nr:EAL domain-containing protein [Desulfospira joergensenii]